MARRAAPFEFSTAAPQRPGRASEAPPPGGVLVVDNGSWQCRAGWAGQPEPRVAFRALLHRPRARSLPDGASVVGDYDTTLLRGVDPTRCSVRSAFEANVVTTLEVQEAVLDHAFERLALRGGRVAHPLLMTEPLLAPPSTRARLAELVFEAYGAPSLAFGADAAFAWAAATRSEAGVLRGASAGVVAACGHSATHALPVVAGAPLLAAAVRLAPGGLAVTEHLAALLAARYPGLLGAGAAGGAGLGGRAEEVKHALCHVALSYADEARRYADLQRAAAQRRFGAAPDGDADEAHGSGGMRFPPGALACVQLLWTPVAVAQQPAPPTAEELARQAERKKAAADRLRAMAAARRAQKAEALAADVAAMEAAAADAAAAEAAGDGDGAAEALAAAGYEDATSLRAALAAASARLRRLRGEADEGDEAEEAPPAPVDDSVKYPLLNVPDADLDADQLRAKRRQRLLKGGEEARARARAAKAAAAAAEAAEAAAEAARFAEQPDVVIAELRSARAELERRCEARRARRLGGAAAGASRRGGDAHRERMRLMATAAGAEPPPAGGPGAKRRRGGAAAGDDDDTFGADDADWDLYRRIDRDGSDSEAERADDAALAKVGARLAAFEAQRREGGFLDDEQAGPAWGLQEQPEVDWNTPEAHQLWLGVERIRAPEILFQPTLAGIDQAGLAEAIAIALQRAPADAHARLRAGPLLLTGGGAALAGLAARLQAELITAGEPGRAMQVVLSSSTPWLDAWRGASLCAAAAVASPAATTAAEWAESGASGLRRKPQLRYA